MAAPAVAAHAAAAHAAAAAAVAARRSSRRPRHHGRTHRLLNGRSRLPRHGRSRRLHNRPKRDFDPVLQIFRLCGNGGQARTLAHLAFSKPHAICQAQNSSARSKTPGNRLRALPQSRKICRSTPKTCTGPRRLGRSRRVAYHSASAPTRRTSRSSSLRNR